MPARKGQRRATLLRRIKRRFHRPGDGRRESKNAARLAVTSPVSVASELVVMNPSPPPSRLVGSPAAPSDEEKAVSPPTSSDSERGSLGPRGVRNTAQVAKDSIPTETPLPKGENLSDIILEKNILAARCSRSEEAPERTSPTNVQKVASPSLDLEIVRMVQTNKEKRSIQQTIFVGDNNKEIETPRSMIMSPSLLAGKNSRPLESYVVPEEDELPSKMPPSERLSIEQSLVAQKNEESVQHEGSSIENAPADLVVLGMNKNHDQSQTTKEECTLYPERRKLQKKGSFVDVSSYEHALDCPSDEKRDSPKNISTRMEPSSEGVAPRLHSDKIERNDAWVKQSTNIRREESPTLVSEVSQCEISIECPSDEHKYLEIPYLGSSSGSELSERTAKEVIFVEEDAVLAEFDMDSRHSSQKSFVPIEETDSLERAQRNSIGAQDDGEFRAGCDVSIIGGTYKGKKGTIIKILPKKIRVSIHDAQGTIERALNKENLLLMKEKIDSDSEESFRTAFERENENDGTLDGHTSTKNLELSTKNVFKIQSNIETASSTDRQRSSPRIQAEMTRVNTLKEGSKVSLIGGTYRGKTGTIVKLLPKKVRVEIDDVNGAFERDLNKQSMRMIGGDTVNHHYASQNIFERPNNSPEQQATEKSSGVREHSDTSHVNDRPINGNAFEVESTIEVAPGSTDEFKTCRSSGNSQRGGEVEPLHEGRHVFIVGGTHSGKRGIVLKILRKKVRVLIEDENRNIKRALNRENLSMAGFHPGEKDVCRTSNDIISLTDVQDTFDRKKGSEVNTIPDHVNVSIGEKKNRVPRVQRSTLSGRAQHRPSLSETAVLASGEGHMWRVPDSKKGGSRFGKRLVTKIRLVRDHGNEDTFLSHWLQRRMFITEIPLNKDEVGDDFDQRMQYNGSVFELISVKLQADTDDPRYNLQYCSPQCVRMAYAQVSGPGLETFSLQEELNRLADFGKLSARKAVARLELFQSPACKFPNHPSKKFGIFFLRDSDFCEIEERGHVGCGFISEDLIIGLCGGNTEAKRKTSIQVRIVIPRLGIFKGMLTKKRANRMISPIELPSSMRKVGPSPTDPYRGAFLLITRNGLHPSPTNHYVGRLLDPRAKAPPKSFDATLKRKPISDMILRLWKEVSVPQEESVKYARLSLRRDHLEHANVVGVADPTGKLPPGHIFVPGMGSQQFLHRNLFVTRFPCNQRWHGRVLPTVTTKPDTMPSDDWELLLEYGFGSIVFGSPKEGELSIPEMISEGDLDGDLYFICWNRKIIEHIQAEPCIPTLHSAVAVNSEDVKSSGDSNNWLPKAQQLMTDAVATQDLSDLTGILYSLSKTAADNSRHFLSDVDAVAFGKAFTQALDFAKHGREIYLPSHLHDKVPVRLQKYLTCTKSS